MHATCLRAAPRPARARSSAAATSLTLGDCDGCHTAEQGKPFAGGLPIDTGFGPIYYPQHHARSRHRHRQLVEGRFLPRPAHRPRRRGQAPLPGVPLSVVHQGDARRRRRDEGLLRSVAPVHQPNKAPELAWWMQLARHVAGWNLLWFDEGTFKPDPKQVAGVEPRRLHRRRPRPLRLTATRRENFLGATTTGDALAGGNTGAVTKRLVCAQPHGSDGPGSATGRGRHRRLPEDGRQCPYRRSRADGRSGDEVDANTTMPTSARWRCT